MRYEVEVRLYLKREGRWELGDVRRYCVEAGKVLSSEIAITLEFIRIYGLDPYGAYRTWEVKSFYKPLE